MHGQLPPAYLVTQVGVASGLHGGAALSVGVVGTMSDIAQ